METCVEAALEQKPKELQLAIGKLRLFLNCHQINIGTFQRHSRPNGVQLKKRISCRKKLKNEETQKTMKTDKPGLYLNLFKLLSKSIPNQIIRNYLLSKEASIKRLLF